VSVNSLFEISQRSLRALNAKMNATSQNIANAETEGYSRRRATLEANNTVSVGRYTSSAQNGTPGDGASLDTYERVRNRVFDQAAAEAQAGKSGAQEEARLLSIMEGSLATDSEGGLTSAMESFFNGFSDLADNPNNEGAREAVLFKANTLRSEFNRLDQEMADLKSNTASSLSDSVDQANDLITEVASLTGEINRTRNSGASDLAAKDRRDKLVKKLSGLAPVEAQERADGDYTLSVDGMTVVQGQETTLLQAKDLTSPSKATVEFGDTGVAFKPGDTDGGEIGAQLRTLNETIPEVRGELDTIAKNVVEKVNDIHTGASDRDNETGTPFFDPNEKTASTIQLDDAIQGADDIGAVRGYDLTTAAGRENAVTVDNGDFGANEGPDNLDARLSDGDVAGNTVEAPIGPDGNLQDGLEGGPLDIQVENNTDPTQPDKDLNFTVENQDGEIVTGGAQAADVSSGSDADIILEESPSAGGDDLKLDVNAFAPGDVPPGETRSFSVSVNTSDPGDTSPAQDISGLSDELTTESIDLAASVGSKVQQAEARAEAKAASADNLESLAGNVSDVSIDEEMSNLIEQQQQFAASARVLRTAREVTSSLLSI
jgi:flagellar hook-associated protein 1 FlgK